jgi:hypothetical protein
MVNLIFIGVIVCIIGIFLPWGSYSISGALSVGAQSFNGLNYIGGIASGGIAIISSILAYFSMRDTFPMKTIGYLIVLAGIVIFMLVASVLFGSTESVWGSGNIMPFKVII